MVIADATISQDVWSAVRTKVVAAAPYVSNSSTAATTAASINSVFNDKTAARPQIIINPALIDEGDWKFGGLQGKKVINVVIECYYSNTLGIDQLWDQVRAALDDNDLDGIDLVAITTDYGFSSPGEQKFHVKSGTFTYQRE
jgi:hypothetical protein